MTFAPRFSPDGQRVIMSLQQGGNANIFVMDLRSQDDDAADRFARDRHLAVLFARRRADRASSRTAAAASRSTSWARNGGGGAAHQLRRRLAIRRRCGRRAATSSPSPSRAAATSRIGVMRPDGSGERVLADGFHNEGPTWAPNGRVLMFFRDPGGNAGPPLYTVDITGRNEQKVPTPSFASDPAWSPLLS